MKNFKIHSRLKFQPTGRPVDFMFKLCYQSEEKYGML